MVIKPVPSLYELSLQVLTNKIFRFIKEHWEKPCALCSVYKTEQCSVIKPVTRMLEDVPETIIQRVYNKVYLEYKSTFDSNTNWLYLFLSVLRFDHTSLKIEDYCFTRYKKDMPFMIKFGKNINSLRLNDEQSIIGTLDNTTADMMKRCRILLLQSAVNLQVLDLKGICATNKLSILKIVGLECMQLKVIRILIKVGIYPKSRTLSGLLFCTNETGTPQRNKCCYTLQVIDFDVPDRKYRLNDTLFNVEMNEMVSMLILNVPHLKSVGPHFYFGGYFKTFLPGEIHRATFHDMNFFGLNDYESIVLKDFCPTVKKLRITAMKSRVAQVLSSFKCLEEIVVKETNAAIYQEISVQHWSNLKIMKLWSSDYKDSFALDLDVIIKNFPVLNELRASIYKNVNWSRTTEFKCLKKVSFDFKTFYADISWFASFANTVQSIEYSHNKDRPDLGTFSYCHVFVTVPFPNLERLYFRAFRPLFYDFVFHSNHIVKFPKLETFIVYYEGEPESRKAQRLEHLSDFMRENNLQCMLNGTCSEPDND